MCTKICGYDFVNPQNYKASNLVQSYLKVQYLFIAL